MAKITKYQFYNIKQPKMNTGLDPADPPDPPDTVRERLLETYQPSRAGVEMTEVLNKLPQINVTYCNFFMEPQKGPTMGPRWTQIWGVNWTPHGAQDGSKYGA